MSAIKIEAGGEGSGLRGHRQYRVDPDWDDEGYPEVIQRVPRRYFKNRR